MSGKSESLVLKNLKTEVFNYIKFRLADGMVDVELDPVHYEISLQRAIDVYRNRSTSGGAEESYGFLTLQHDVQEYILPQEVTHVRQMFRRTIGTASNGTGNEFDAFEGQMINTYLLNAQNPLGGLLTYELYTNYQNLTARMFGGYIDFFFNTVTKKLTLVRKIHATGELVMLWLYNLKPEFQLLSDYQSAAWIKEYAMFVATGILGEAREKYSSIAGPSSGTTLNGAALKSQSVVGMTKLEDELKLHLYAGTPLGFLFG